MIAVDFRIGENLRLYFIIHFSSAKRFHYSFFICLPAWKGDEGRICCAVAQLDMRFALDMLLTQLDIRLRRSICLLAQTWKGGRNICRGGYHPPALPGGILGLEIGSIVCSPTRVR